LLQFRAFCDILLLVSLARSCLSHLFFFSSRRRHTRCYRDWSSDVCSSDLEDVLMGLADRIDLVDVRILVTAILIQRDVGGNLAEVLDKISHTTRARFTIRRQVRVHTAQGRFSGYVLAVLPIAARSAICVINREYML